MGSSSSKGKRPDGSAKYGQLYLQTDKSVYSGGENVTGRIYLNLIQPFPGNQLFLKFKGKETTFIVYTTTSHNVRRVEMDNGVNNIIKMTVPAYTWSTLEPGQYTIPFAFLLPVDLPSTFYQEGPRYLADISYRLEAVLSSTAKDGPLMKYKQPIVLRQPLKNTQEVPTKELTAKVTTCCCCPKGTSSLKASFEKNWYTPGELAKVELKLDNANSKLDTLKLTASLVQTLKIKAGDQDETYTLTKVERDIKGVKAGCTGNPDVVELQLPTFDSSTNNLKKSDMRAYLRGIREELNLLNSEAKGKLVSSEYSLQIIADMDTCCPTDPEISLPISMYYPDIQFAPVSAPDNWQPKELALANVAFGGFAAPSYPLQSSAPQSGYPQQVQQGGNQTMTGMTSGNDMNQQPSEKNENQYNDNYYAKK